MVNNQIEFNNEYSKEVKEIEIKNEDFQGSLVVGNYLKLEDLYLYNISSVNKLTLKNLPQLQNCTIQGCDTTELIIESCPQIKELNIQTNFLTNLEFLTSLNKLETLKVDGNPKLSEILKPYQNNWKIYREEIQKMIKLAKISPQKLLDVQEENKASKEKYNILKTALASFSAEIQKEIKEKEIAEINSKIKETETKEVIISPTMITEKLLTLTQINVEKLREWKEEKQKELSELKKKKEELEERLIKEKKEQLEKLKSEFLAEKKGFLANFSSNNKKEKVQRKLGIYLDSNNSKVAREDAKEWLLKRELENSKLTRLLNELYTKQQEISLLETPQKVITEETQITTKEENKKALELEIKKDKIQIGIQIPQWGINVGVNKEKERTNLTAYIEENLQQQISGLTQKIVEQILEIQKTEAQIQVDPK